MSRPLRPGEPWEHPAGHDVPLDVVGGDTDLAAAVADRPGVLVRFTPRDRSDLARALGIRDGVPGRRLEVSMDLLLLDDGAPAVNAVVVGAPPRRTRWGSRWRDLEVTVDGRTVFAGRATGVVIASGQFLDGDDAVPRAHPGDGRVDVQVYAVARRERRAMRSRLRTGEHVPHPAIVATSGRRVEVWARRGAVGVEVDGRRCPGTRHLGVTVRTGSFRLLL